MTDFLMPSLGADMESGKLVEWLVKPGDIVRKGDIVAVVETHKGAIDIECFEAGLVDTLCVAEGDTVPVGALLARLRAPDETLPATPVPHVAPAPVAPAAAIPTSMPAIERPAPAASPASSGRTKITPAARRLAAELGIDPASLAGTGFESAVSYADVELARSRGIPQAKPSAASGPAERHGGFDPSEMRKAITAAVSRSKREIPHYYLSSTIDMAPSLAWLSAFNGTRSPDERMLPAVLLLKAAALALRDVPLLNGLWQDRAFVPGKGIHIGWAISLRGGGLVAPAIHDVDTLALPELMARLRDLVARARSGGLRSSEMMDATITITSLGERGADAVIGVIYPPQVAILGFGRISERPWVVAGKVEPRPLIDVSLSADHRASDGHAGGLLLSAMERYLKEPENL